MLTKIAIISDIHGNLNALNSVLKDIKRRKIKHIYCLGDIAFKGSNPSECIKLIRKNCEVVIQGNCDEIFSRDSCDKNNEKGNWNYNLLKQEDREYLRKLPFCHEFYMSGSYVRILHSTPTSQFDFININEDNDKKYKLFLPSKYTISDKKADILIQGHYHTQHLEKLYNRTRIITGSVGNPMNNISNSVMNASSKETTMANYFIIEGSLNSDKYDEDLSLQFVKVKYDIESELETDKFIYDKPSYAKELLEGEYYDKT